MQRAGKYCSIRRIEYPEFQTGISIFLVRESREAANASREAARKKNSGYLGLASHFHADARCQTRQIYNYKRDQWQHSKLVLISH